MSTLPFRSNNRAPGLDGAWLRSFPLSRLQAGFQRADWHPVQPAAVSHRWGVPGGLLAPAVYKLSLRDLAERFLERGIVFTHEAMREWESLLAPLITQALRKQRRGKIGKSWYVDEIYIKTKGQGCYLSGPWSIDKVSLSTIF
jgi:Transposase and inactivated derivatives